MSELIDNTERKKQLLKHLMLQLHQGEAPEAVRTQLGRLMGEVPYDQVVEVEQELLAEGLRTEEILRFCDLHTAVLKGNINQEGAKTAPPGHPAHTFAEENRAVQWESDLLKSLFNQLQSTPDDPDLRDRIRLRFFALTDIEKHYSRKENLLFPSLERHGIHGPSTVMWAKDDEVRELLKAGVEALRTADITQEELQSLVELVLMPALDAIEDMIFRETQVLLPMSLDVLSEAEWVAIHRQSPEIGFCLIDPKDTWVPAETPLSEPEGETSRIQLPSGSMSPEELTAILNAIPFDLTFVDREDRVRYFTQGRERIFTRTRAILGRKVQLCHPPSSVHIVERILDDFKSGRESRAPFWIEMKGKFIHIEYFALRDAAGNYLGTLEVSQDLTQKRALQGEQRLLSYAKEE